MIVIIDGRAINPEHVATVIPYGNECDVTITLSSGKFITLPIHKDESDEEALERIVLELNKALSPWRTWYPGMV
jgi:uncharacterized protein YlzI (FlbEa/FlbD family)